MGTVSPADQLSDRPRRVDSFLGLIANFYSLKTKKIPAGKLVLGDWLGRYKVTTRMSFFASFGVRKPAGDDLGVFWPW